VLLDDGREGWVVQSAVKVEREVVRQDAQAPQTSASHPGIYRQSWAVIVGVNRFRDARIGSLNYATNDAQTVAQALGPLGFPVPNITVLLDAQATKGEIERVLSSVVRRATTPEDRLFLFFATHGMTEPLPGGGEEGYLVFHDTDPTDLPYTALSMSELKRMGQRIPARHILVAVDACYGGHTMLRAQAPPGPRPTLSGVDAAKPGYPGAHGRAQEPACARRAGPRRLHPQAP
jgi:Caspase domain